MSNKQSKKFRKLYRKQAQALVTADVKREAYKLAHMRDWFLVGMIAEFLIIGVLTFFLLKAHGVF